MKPRIAIKIFVLQAVASCGGEPIPEDALVTQTQLALPHLGLIPDDVVEIALGLVATGHMVATADALTEQKLYTITPKGTAAIAAHHAK